MSSTSLLTDDRARGFTANVAPLRYGSFQVDEHEAFAFAVRTISPKSRVLDVGCGGGDLALYLSTESQCIVTGLEPNAERAEKTRQLGVAVHAGYLDETFCNANGPFDVILFMDVLEHTVDPVELIILARRMLSPSGSIIISVPNVAHWTVRIKLAGGVFDYKPTGIMDATHLRWFTSKTIKNVVETGGLKVIDSQVSRGHWMNCYRTHPPFRWLPAAWKRPLLNRLCKLWPGLFGCQHLICASCVE